MVRWYILRTLLRKELLRYRYNWGLLVMVFALLGLAALVSVGARLRMLPGQADWKLEVCYVVAEPGSGWADYLRRHPPSFAHSLRFLEIAAGRPRFQRFTQVAMIVELLGPARGDAAHKARLRFSLPEMGTVVPREALAYRDWAAAQTRDFLGTTPAFVEETRTLPLATTASDRPDQAATTDPIPTIITALVSFSLYLLSFNLYITSTGEEREKRVLLAQLLTPASATEIILAKILFYAVAAVAAGVAVVCMYRPDRLLHPGLLLTMAAGASGYVAIGTVVVSLVRRQTTINSVSMVYLLLTSVILFLAATLPLFNILKALLIENYTYALLNMILAEEYSKSVAVNLFVLLVLVGAWTAVAIRLFGKQGMEISRHR